MLTKQSNKQTNKQTNKQMEQNLSGSATNSSPIEKIHRILYNPEVLHKSLTTISILNQMNTVYALPNY
jgi:hypothetical protein